MWGGGPGGLYVAISLKLRDATHSVSLFERNQPDDTFGWGVVLSEDTLSNLDSNDLVSAAAIRAHIAYWDDVAVEKGGVRTVSTGHGFSGDRAPAPAATAPRRGPRELGVELHFQDEVADIGALMAEFDLVVAADGLNSRIRDVFAPVFQPDIELYSNKFVWLGTHQTFKDAFTFIFEPTETRLDVGSRLPVRAGNGDLHCRVLGGHLGAGGFWRYEPRKSRSPSASASSPPHLGGHALLSNANHIRGSRLDQLSQGAVRALASREPGASGRRGGQAPTSPSARAPSWRWRARRPWRKRCGGGGPLSAVLERYEQARKTEALRLQSAARNSAAWFEEVERYLPLDPVQFNYSLLTRSQRISHENLRLRDGAWLSGCGNSGFRPGRERPMSRVHRCSRRFGFEI